MRGAHARRLERLRALQRHFRFLKQETQVEREENG